MSERQNIEWKQSWHNDYPKWVCGFANAVGGTLKIIEACKDAGLAEPLLEETNGGITVTLYNREFGKHSEDLRNKFGISSEEIRNEFGTIATLINSEPSKNNALIQDHLEGFMAHLQSEFGITSEKLRKSFGKASEKKIPNPTKTLFIIVLFPEATAEQIGEILGVSSRSAETYIQKLKAEGLLEREGGKKEGNWQIKRMN